MARFEPTDQQSQQIEPPLRSGKRGRPYTEHRPAVNGPASAGCSPPEPAGLIYPHAMDPGRPPMTALLWLR